MDRDTAALVVALVALLISFGGNLVLWDVASENRVVIRESRRGLVCVLQRAQAAAKASQFSTAEDKQRAVAFYAREIAFLGGPRDDCMLPTNRGEQG